MKLNYIFFYLVLTSQLVLGQIDSKIPFVPEKVQEQIYIHMNTPLLIPGEPLEYSLYNLNTSTHELSKISKIATVLLFDRNGEKIFTQKLHLENGRAYSDFLIPSNLPTGIYTLIGYTNWMENYNFEGIFKKEIFIINPYLKETDNHVVFKEKNPEYDFKSGYQIKNQLLSIRLNDSVFDSRDKVKFDIINTQKTQNIPSISVSVRRVDSLIQENSSYLSNLQNKDNSKFTLKTLPEIRGRKFKGNITSEGGNKLNQPMHLAFNVAGRPQDFRIFDSEADGSFVFEIPEKINYSEAYFKLLDENYNDYDITLENLEPSFNPIIDKFLYIPKLAKKRIEKIAIYNQIQQSYKSVFKDSLLIQEAGSPFFGNKGITYNLNDYTRFQTMAETFVEIIQFASFRNTGENHELLVSGYDMSTSFNNSPLILIDGIISSSSDLYNLNPSEVKSIEVVRDKYFLGPAIFNGIVNVMTFKRYSFQLKNFKKIDITPAEPDKLYYQPNYSYMSNDRIPDFRRQLYWNPKVETKTIEFYTSDLPGLYEIRVEGFIDHKYISLRKTFKVK